MTVSRQARRHRSVGRCALFIGLSLSTAPAHAQATGLAELQSELAALKAEQARSAARIEQLEKTLAALAGPAPAATASSPTPSPAPSWVAAPIPALQASPASAVNPAGGSAPGGPPRSATSRLAIGGDVRLRYEGNSSDSDARNRDRTTIRARLRATYAVNNWLSVGGQLATGDPDDPNSSDITLSGFDDNLDVSLDQVYARATFGGFDIYAGKMPQTLVRTELLWDGDVNPEGVSASYRHDLGGGLSAGANAVYFIVDESAAGPNSAMAGGQITLQSALKAPVRIELAAGYYDYSLRSTAGGDIGDFRTNRFANGRYLSDYNLLDLVGAVTWAGPGERWPLRLVADYVHNFGATVKADSAYGVDLLLGRTGKKGDLRFGYGYAQAGVDAVLAAFSQDNTTIGSNYIQHSLSIDYVPVDHVLLNATLVHYRPKSALYAGLNAPDDWLDRLRLSVMVGF